MEPFDYLSYKQSKMGISPAQSNERRKVQIKKSGKLIYYVCFISFISFFLVFFNVISSRTSKIDIEYGRFGQNNEPVFKMQNDTELNKEETEETEQNLNHKEVDNRLYLISQEEKGPSISKPKDTKIQNEIISKKNFEEIKSNNSNKITDFKQNAPTPQTDKPALKGKLPVRTTASTSQTQTQTVVPKPLSALEQPITSSKVLIGRFSTLAEAREIQNNVGSVSNSSPFVKKINNYYSIQVGSYDNYETAKEQAAKYKSKGFDAWILQ